jgi:hypothetical protein
MNEDEKKDRRKQQWQDDARVSESFICPGLHTLNTKIEAMQFDSLISYEPRGGE